MFFPTVVMGILALTLSILAYSKGKHIVGIKSSLQMITEVLPLLVFAFIVAGMVRTILPHELLSRWIGAESGIKGIFIGTLAGAAAPGGSYVGLPIVASLLRSGASIGTMVAFLTA